MANVLIKCFIFLQSVAPIYGGKNYRDHVRPDALSNWLKRNAARYYSIVFPTREYGRHKFDVAVLADTPAGKKQYVDDVAPGTFAIGFVLGRGPNETEKAKVHTYVRFGDKARWIDEGTDEVHSAKAGDLYDSVVSIKDFSYVPKNAAKPKVMQVTMHDLPMKVSEKELKALEKFYADFQEGNIKKPDGTPYKFVYRTLGFGEPDENGALQLNCYTFALLFTFPQLNKNYPEVRKLVKELGLKLPRGDRKRGYIHPFTFARLMGKLKGSGIVSMGNNIHLKDIDNPAWSIFMKESRFGNQLGVIYDKKEILDDLTNEVEPLPTWPRRRVPEFIGAGSQN